jgi:hypothetical protein
MTIAPERRVKYALSGVLGGRSVRGGCKMAYLDLTPMLQAMRTRPSEFDMQDSYLRHIPSQHLLTFNLRGNARVHARCDCAMLDVSREQSEEMKAAISAWKIVYWEPRLAQIAAEKRAAKINREFAAHFRPSAWQRFLALLRRRDSSPVIAHRPAEIPRKAAQERSASGEAATHELVHG